MSVDDGVRVLESELAGLAEWLTAPRVGECLMCFTNRMLVQFPCDSTLRWTKHWQKTRAPRATALRRRLGRHGAFCDCEIFTNGWWPTTTDGLTEETADELRVCPGVRPGSTQPCSLWTLRRPSGWW